MVEVVVYVSLPVVVGVHEVLTTERCGLLHITRHEIDLHVRKVYKTECQICPALFTVRHINSLGVEMQ